MAISLSLEVAELLELMQWKNGDALLSHLAKERQAVEQELSDILYWTLLLANDLNVDLARAFFDKMKINEAKYPIDKAAGSSEKYDRLD